MAYQPGFETEEIGSEAVAHGRVRRFKLDTGDERRVHAEINLDRPTENFGQTRSAGLCFRSRQ
jgi:hypothetical protein